LKAKPCAHAQGVIYIAIAQVRSLINDVNYISVIERDRQGFSGDPLASMPAQPKSAHFADKMRNEGQRI